MFSLSLSKQFVTYPSSTAQGGGGSFKNRKPIGPIGEVGCCESRMAERIHWWTERWLRFPLFLSLSLSFSDYLPTYLPTDPSIYLSFYLSVYLSIYLSLSLICLSNCLSIYLSLSIYPSIHLSIYLPTDLSIYLPTDLSIYLYPSIHPSIHPSIYLIYLFYLFYLSILSILSIYSIYLSIYLSFYLPIQLCIYLSTYLSICLSIYLSICKVENQAILRDFLIFQSWQHQKRSNSPRLPHCLHVTTPKTKQFCVTSSFFELDNIKNEAILRDVFIFWTWQHPKRNKTRQLCETSSIFELDNIKNKAILRDFLQKWKVDCSAAGLVPMSFAIFPLHLSKVLRLPRKSEARSCEVLHLSRKIIFPKLKISGSKMKPLSGNQRPTS